MFNLTIEDSNGQVAEQFAFDHGSYVIGRADECDIVLPSASVSRKHARIFVEGGRCYIEDMGSANGVIVDGQRVMQRRDLGTASQIRVGHFFLYLEFKTSKSGLGDKALDTVFIPNDSDHSKLVRVNDSFAGEEFGLSETDNTIGRTDDNFILLSDNSISRHHARILREGDEYTLVDLGSSNGTKLNGKQLRGSKRLSEGDLVRFGNVEFIFTDGSRPIDLQQTYGRTKGSNQLVIIGGLVVLVLVGLIAGAMIVFGFFELKQNKAADHPAVGAEQSLAARADAALEEGKSQMRRREWARAIGSFDEVLALAPDHPDAAQLRSQAKREQEADELLLKGEDLSEQGRHSEAKQTLEKIPEDTVAFQRARPTLDHVNKTIAYNLRNEAEHLLDKKASVQELKDAHQKLVRALTLDGSDSETTELLESVEQKMRDRKIEFSPFARR